MARIPDEQIERLKQEVSLVRLVESQGYKPKRQGKDYVIRCPFHEDDTPSLVISPANNLYHCFGCGAAGSVIDWTIKTQGLSFRHAVELLKSGDILQMAAGNESSGKTGSGLAIMHKTGTQEQEHRNRTPMFQKAPPALQPAGLLLYFLLTVNTNLPGLTCTLTLAPMVKPSFSSQRPFI
jgi:DNA primase